jgi:cytochrome c55X
MRAAAWLLALPVAVAAQPAAPSPARQDDLVRVVRQDCGSCHGMRLTGGLGPALTPEALAGKPVESLAATIVHGRPGTPMPGWRAMLSEADAQWIAEQLLRGFPDERRAAR